MSFNKGAARCFNCSGVKLLRANSRIAVSPRVGQEGAAIGLLVLAMVKGLARREGEISNISNNATEGRIRMKGHYSNIRGQIGRARDGLLETAGERIVWGVDGTTVRSGLRRGDLSKFKPLVLIFPGGMGPVTRRLLDLPNGLHFREFALSWLREEDLQWIIALIAGCSHTLERLFIKCFLPGALTLFLHLTCNSSSLTGDAGPASIDLSKATNLEDAVFLPTSMSVKWIILALQTITPKHLNLRGVSVYVPYDPTLTNAGADVAQVIGDLICGQWLDLDRFLVQIWESRSIRPKVLSTTRHIGYSVGGLLPEITKRGIIDLACRCYVPQ